MSVYLSVLLSACLFVWHTSFFLRLLIRPPVFSGCMLTSCLPKFISYMYACLILCDLNLVRLFFSVCITACPCQFCMLVYLCVCFSFCVACSSVWFSVRLKTEIVLINFCCVDISRARHRNRIIIVNSKLQKHHSKAKRRSQAYSRWRSEPSCNLANIQICMQRQNATAAYSFETDIL